MHRRPLVSTRRPARQQDGFTISEFLVVMVVFIALIMIVVVSLRGIDKGSAERDCRSELRSVKAATQRYRAERGDYPADVGELREAGFLESGEVTHYAVAVNGEGTVVFKPVGSRCD